jgi:hypothetical protein
LAGPVTGRTMRVGSPSSKASSTLCRRRGFEKSLESLPHVFHIDRRSSFLGCPAKGNPLSKIRVLGSCRKSASRRRIFFFDRPALSFWLPSGRRSYSSIARRWPRLFCLLLCLVLTHQAEDRWLAHARPTGCPWGVTWAQRPKTTSTYLCTVNPRAAHADPQGH